MAKYEARGNVPEGKVQRKFYLSEVLADILRIEAAKRNESQSSIVERALRKELGLMLDRAAVTAVRMTPGEAWEGFVGSQGVAEFLAISRDRGHHTPEAAVAAYLDEGYDDLTHDIANPISRDALEGLLLRYIKANMPAIDAEAYQTTYTDAAGRTYEAIQLPWAVVRNLLGHDHTGAAADDSRLIEMLRAAGAPDWVRPSVAGWVDEHGWGIYAPTPLTERLARELFDIYRRHLAATLECSEDEMAAVAARLADEDFETLAAAQNAAEEAAWAETRRDPEWPRAGSEEEDAIAEAFQRLRMEAGY